MNSRHQTEFSFTSSEFLEYLEAHGSVRLVNCFKAGLEASLFPYSIYSQFQADALENKERRLNRIPNLGKKTIQEFFALVEAYAARVETSLIDSQESMLNETENVSTSESSRCNTADTDDGSSVSSECLSFDSDAFLEFLSRTASTRTFNAVRDSFYDASFPYRDFEEFLRDTQSARWKKFLLLPRIGRRSVVELLDLIEQYRRIKSLTGSRTGSQCSPIWNSVTPQEDLSLESAEFLSYLQRNTRESVALRVSDIIKSGLFPYPDCPAFFRDVYAERVRKLGSVLGVSSKEILELLLCIARYAKHHMLSGDSVPTASIAQETTASSDQVLIPPMPETSDPRVALSQIDERERIILMHRFGVDGYARKTLEELGSQLDVTRERIRQLQAKAIKRLAFDKATWATLLQDKQSEILDAYFSDADFVQEARDIGGLEGLAIAIVDKKSRQFLNRVAVPFHNGWIRPDLDANEIERCIKDLSSSLLSRISFDYPLRVSSLATKLEVRERELEVAVGLLNEYSIYGGFVVEGRATARKRRTVNLIRLFDQQKLPSPSDVWEMKRVYWASYEDDRCGGRDLFISLESHPNHFINLHELGWMALRERDCILTRKTDCVEVAVNSDAYELLYEEPIKDSDGLVNRLYRLFVDAGPMQLKQAASLFHERYPQYAVSSMYPMMVVHAAFVRLAPGVFGIQRHLIDETSRQAARDEMLDPRQVDLFLLARRSAPPELSYPLWDAQMERQWCDWLFENGDLERVGELLRYASVERWDLESAELSWWLQQKKRLERPIHEPSIARLEERFVDTAVFLVTLAAASISGFTNWMHVNQGLGWRIETTRVALVLAILVHLSALRPTGRWFEAHEITDKGRTLLSELLRIRSSGGDSDAELQVLTKCYAPSANLGWAEDYSFNNLISKVHVAENSGSSNNHSAAVEKEEEVNLEDFYARISKDQLDDLIEGDDEYSPI